MYKTLTRALVIRALRTEPLTAERWVKWSDDTIDGKVCGVCAVGAVLRTAGVPDVDVEIYADLNTGFCFNAGSVNDGATMNEAQILEYVAEQLADNTTLPLLALSRLHESLWERAWTNKGPRHYATKAYRETLVAWVKANFPPTIKVRVADKAARP